MSSQPTDHQLASLSRADARDAWRVTYLPFPPFSTLCKSTTMHLGQTPAIVLSIEFFLGGIPRLVPRLIPRVGERIDRKYPGSVHALWPVIPIRDPAWHRRFIGALMTLTGVLLALPDTRGSAFTFGLVGFLTGCGIVRCGKGLRRT